MRHFGKVVTAAVVLALFAVLAPGQEAAGSDEGWITTWSSISSSSSRKYGLAFSSQTWGPGLSLRLPMRSAVHDSHVAHLLAKGQYDEAIVALDAAIRHDPNDAGSYVNRGLAWAMEGDLDTAIADFDEAIRLNPRQDAAHSNRGNAWQGKGELEKAIADYNVAIRLDPNCGAFYNNRGSAWLAMGEIDKAIDDCNDAMRLDPRMNHIHYYNRGLAWRSKWELDKAIADYTEALRLEPTDARTYVARCNAWRLKGVLTKAIADANEATRLDPHVRIANDPRSRSSNPPLPPQSLDPHIKIANEPRRDRPDAYAVSTRGMAEFDAAAGLGLISAVAEMGPSSVEKSKQKSYGAESGAK